MAKESHAYFDDGVMDTRVKRNLRSLEGERCISIDPMQSKKWES